MPVKTSESAELKGDILDLEGKEQCAFDLFFCEVKL